MKYYKDLLTEMENQLRLAIDLATTDKEVSYIKYIALLNLQKEIEYAYQVLDIAK